LTLSPAILAFSAALAFSSERSNPFEGDAAAIQAGSALFGVRCADCHGADAKGARGPDLTALWAAGGNDERVFGSVRLGVAGSIMPPSAAPDAEIWAIVAYLRDLSTVPPFAIAGADHARGRELFGAHCSDCHRVGDDGGRLGPELTRIAEIRSREALADAIRAPSASIPRGYRGASVTTRRGELARGVVKSEDAFSIQMMHTDGRLRGFRKADLSEIRHEAESPMPPFSSETLSERDLDDLVAFLGTLRRSSEAD
jgi:putative heme-binding domain-containing protein